MDNSVVIVGRGLGKGWLEMEEGIGGINGNGKNAKKNFAKKKAKFNLFIHWWVCIEHELWAQSVLGKKILIMIMVHIK